MKNLTKVSLITVCSFLLILFCGYSLAETGSSPAASASAAVKASEETPFPRTISPGIVCEQIARLFRLLSCQLGREQHQTCPVVFSG